jgi:hypothetical protein
MKKRMKRRDPGINLTALLIYNKWWAMTEKRKLPLWCKVKLIFARYHSLIEFWAQRHNLKLKMSSSTYRRELHPPLQSLEHPARSWLHCNQANYVSSVTKRSLSKLSSQWVLKRSLSNTSKITCASWETNLLSMLWTLTERRLKDYLSPRTITARADKSWMSWPLTTEWRSTVSRSIPKLS